ncbi:FAD-binding protein [Bacteroides cellulosilyticus]|uniref:UDP-N-acetylenolpyruvoylglucosamine reductase n=2 Tax=Bacteroides cellulosilyticus TaxID=246787 RepID=A0A5M6A8F1_9BACE|nr:FAD-binding protein [Bacteroides cellulosilyticus]RYU17368.1 FAD-binding protein [Bacteroides cellulosilyticus]
MFGAMLSDLKRMLSNHKIFFQEGVSLAEKTWIRRGGIVKYWIVPTSVEKLVVLVKYLYVNKLFFELVGHTSNIYFLNNYNPDIVISTRKINCFFDNDDVLICDCGVSMKILSKYCIEHGYRGFEGLIDLPGTVAAAVYNNSGCFKCSVSDLLIKVDFLDKNGDLIELNSRQMKFTHRSSCFKTKEMEGVILRVYLKKIKSDSVKLARIAADNRQYRKMYQESPKQNLGSTFATIPFKKNPLLFVSVLTKICVVFKVDKKRKWVLIKYILLFIYGKLELSRYISDYSLNRFVWIDEQADEKFWLYKLFIERISNSPQLEIEIKKIN